MRLSRYLQNINVYQLALLLISVAGLLSYLFFYVSGYMDPERTKDLNKASFMVDDLTNKKPLMEVKSLVQNENNKIALTKLNELENRLKEVNVIIHNDDFDIVIEEHESLRGELANLVSHTPSSKVIPILRNRIQGFKTSMEQKKWMTLTRTAQRVYKQLDGYVKKDLLVTLARKVKREFQRARTITEDSTLTPGEKRFVYKKLEQINAEVSMLLKYGKAKDSFSKKLKGYDKTLFAWLSDISPSILDERLKIENANQYFTQTLLAISLGGFVLLVGCFLVDRLRKNRLKSQRDLELKSLINDYLINGQKDEDLFQRQSVATKTFLSDTKEYLDRRLKFSSIVKDAMPFATVLFDDSLKSVWMNNVFIEDWSLSEDYSDSWKEIIKMTNLHDTDPVLEAMKTQISGIFQIKMKKGPREEARHFEMYVAPTKVNRQSHVIVIFYPLDSVKDTIDDQVQSILAPVSEITSLIASNNFTQESEKRLRENFSLANISSLYGYFLQLNDMIESKQSKLSLLEQQNTELEVSCTQQQEFLSKIEQSFLEIKNQFVKLITISEQNNISSELNAKNANWALSSLLKYKANQDVLTARSNSKQTIIEGFTRVKDELKSLRTQLYENKMRAMQQFSSLRVVLKRELAQHSDTSRIKAETDKVVASFNEIDENINSLQLLTKNIEVQLGRSSYIDNECGELKFVEEQNFSIIASQSITSEQDQIISSLTSIYKDIKEIRSMPMANFMLKNADENHARYM